MHKRLNMSLEQSKLFLPKLIFFLCGHKGLPNSKTAVGTHTNLDSEMNILQFMPIQIRENKIINAML